MEKKLRNTFLSLFFFILPLIAHSQESEKTITITTYYPAPYGVYKYLRLYPTTCASADCQDANDIGTLCFDKDTQQVKVCIEDPDSPGNYIWKQVGTTPKAIQARRSDTQEWVTVDDYKGYRYEDSTIVYVGASHDWRIITKTWGDFTMKCVSTDGSNCYGIEVIGHVDPRIYYPPAGVDILLEFSSGREYIPADYCSHCDSLRAIYYSEGVSASPYGEATCRYLHPSKCECHDYVPSKSFIHTLICASQDWWYDDLRVVLKE